MDKVEEKLIDFTAKRKIWIESVAAVQQEEDDEEFNEADYSILEKQVIRSYVQCVARSMDTPVRKVKLMMGQFYATVSEIHAQGRNITNEALIEKVGKPANIALDLLTQSGDDVDKLLEKVNIARWLKKFFVFFASTIAAMFFILVLSVLADSSFVATHRNPAEIRAPVIYSENQSIPWQDSEL